MSSHVVQRACVVAVFGAILLAGCTDKRVKEVDTGIARDSALSLLGKGAPGVDSLPNVYSRERYLINGKNYEVFFFSGSGKHAYTSKDTMPYSELTPIALIDNRVVGKGWDYLDSLYTANKIPLKKH
jgi:hypothetical protein